MPYIDPVTGAYVADSLNALPPGYNQPSASDAANIAKMRAAITNQATQTPAPSSTPSFIQPIQAVMQNMPGAPVGQAAISMGSDMLGGLLGNLYGAYKGITGGEYGKGTDIAQQNAALAAQNLHYTPPTQQGQNLVRAINKLPEQITGSSMGIGPLPELMGMNYRFTPDDLRAGATSAITDVRNFPMDYANAKAGLVRDYPTLGSRAAGATDTATAMAKPLAEMAYNQIMETGGIKQPFGMPDIPVANFAVKPKGGNWPTNLGSTIPLSEQSSLGKHLSILQIDDPVKAFVKQFEKHHPSILDNYRLQQAWEEFLNEYGLKKDPEFNNYVGKNPRVLELTKEAANEFAKKFNIGAEQAGNKKLYTPAQIEEIAPHYNAWIMGPYQKYITNQMGTGLETDPMLKTLDEANVPISNFFNQNGREIKGLFPEVKPLTETQASIVEHGRESALRKYRDTNQNLLNTNIGKETALTPSGKRMEADIDRSLYPRTFAYSKFDDPKYPAGSKLERYSVVNDLNHYDVEEGTGLPAVRKRVLHDLLQGKLQPKDLQKALPANVLQKLIDEYKSAQKSKEAVEQAKDDWRKSRFESIQSDVPYDDGSKMHIIRPEDVQTDTGKNLALRDLGLSTIDLKQCIGAGCRNTPDYPTPEYNHGPYIEPHTGKVVKGADPYEQTHARRYMDRLERGKAEIARLLDPKGVAQASVDMHYEAPRVLRVSQQADIIANWLEKNNHAAYLEFVDNKNNFGSAEAVKNAYQLYPEVREYVEKLQGAPTKYIAEMKGYDNQKVKPEYVPHMVKFLNQHADQLTDVRDLKNLPEVHDLKNTYDAVGNMSDKRQDWYSPTVEQFLDKVESENLLPRFFTTDQFEALAGDMQVDLSAEPPKKLSDWDKQTLREEVYSVLVKDPESLYLQDNLKDHVVENLDILFGDRKPEGQVSLDTHRKLVDMLLDHNGKYRDQLISALGQLADKGPNGWVDEFTEPQITNMLNIMADWFKKHPMEKLPSNADFERAIQKHPNPFSEIKIPESPWHPSENELANGAHEMEPNEQDHVNAIRQRAYENASEMVRGLYTTDFLRRLYEGDMDARQSIVTDMVASPRTYGLTNYSPAARNTVIERIMQEGIFWPHENPREE